MKLYKFRSFAAFDRTLDILVNQRLYCSPYKDLNDPFEGMLKVKRGTPLWLMSNSFMRMLGPPREEHTDLSKIAPELPNTRICSLSRSFQDVRMWALYADSFSGLAIELELPNDLPELHPVTYGEKLPFISPPKEKEISSSDILTKKTKHWMYEEEVRLISESEFYSVEGKITGIYIGTRTQSHHRELLNRLTLDIPIHETVLDHESVTVIKRATV